MPKNSGRVGPYSKPNALAALDGRRREAKLIAQTRSELVAHVGGKPNAIQRRLIERAAVLALRLALMDARAPDGNMSEKDTREYLAWSNSYVRTLRELGPASMPTPPSLRDYLKTGAPK